MAIGNVTAAAHLYDVNRKTVKRTETKKSAIAPREESVKFSSESKKAENRTALERVVDATPEVRIQLVEDLKAKIASNDYPIESKLDDIVRRMIQEGPFNSVA